MNRTARRSAPHATPRRTPLAAVAAALAGALLLAGCGGGSDGAGSDAGGETVTLRVLAAASLTETFTALGERFEAANPGTRVELSFGPSSGLAEQIGSGAPADVFAAASPSTMQTVVDSGDAQDPQDFATNRAEIAVPAANPGDVDALADLADPAVKVAVCDPEVPCGALAADVLASAGLDVTPVTEEEDVKAVLTKVTLGEVDAGLVYVTDVQAAGDEVRGVEVPEADAASTTYPIAALAGSEHAEQARAFVDLVLSEEGRTALEDAGFGLP
ncbi:molybdate ABC transporter substrate-binding protein [Nocardioides aurantiacus]|uniref:molybdate ABC transporter substrate-binding protein n=1 Tax=Nocardioides aurantiacus TaxID=86796 RepID=UPI00403F6E4A